MERSTCRPRPWILLAVFGVILAVTGSASAQPGPEQLAAREATRKQALSASPLSPVTVVDGSPRPLPGVVTRPADDSAPATARGGEVDAGQRQPESLSTVTDEAGMAVPLGGDDVVVASSANFAGSAYLHVLSDGTYVGSVAALGDVYLYKSTDKGESWTLWSTFSDPSGFVDWLPEVIVAEGTADRILFAYESADEVRLAYADVYAPVPVWTIVTVFANMGIHHGVNNRIDIAADAVSYANYYVYVVAESDDANGNDIWFARSINMGSSFQPAYRIADSTTGSYDSYAAPTICFGSFDYLHVAYLSHVTSPSMLDDATYRRAPLSADGGAGSWEAPQTIYPQSGSNRAIPLRISAGITHGGVYLSMLQISPGVIGLLRYSTDLGASWPSLNASNNVPIGGGTAPLETPSGDLFMAGTFSTAPDFNVSIGRSTVAAPSTWVLPQSCSRHFWSGTPIYARIEGLAVDPAFGNRWALLWVQTTTPKRLRFDAEWRRDPGYPNTDVGFPIAVSGGGQTPPAVAEVDGDAQKEIVFGTIAGDIHVLNHNGTAVPGWPVNIGGMPFDAPVAVGDLVGNGEVSVVAGGTNGFVYAFDPQGNPLDGWPVDLGTGTAVYVSIGALGPPSTRYVVALSAKKVAIINFYGTNVAPAWIPPEIPYGTYTRPAAIGDVDDNGVTDIVSLAGPNVYYHQLGVPGYTGNQFPGETFSDAPTLADIDEDGDLEVAMPTASGKMYIENPGDLVFFPGWPVTVSPGVPLTSAAMAQFLGPTEAELVFGDANGNVHLYWFDGIAQTSYPKASGGTILYMPPIVTRVSGSVSSIAVGTTAAGTGTSQSWSNIGVVPAGWPKNLPGAVEETFASGDIDNDGRNEIVVLGVNFLTVLDVGTAPASAARNHWPMYGYDAQRTGCLACEEILVGVGDTPSRAPANAIEVHPNPFNPTATIEYDVARAGKVSLEIFDVGGRHVATLIDNESRDAGHYSVTYSATGESGVYFARLRTVDGHVTGKIVLLK